MRLSNKSTFSLACLVLLFAFATAPVMADTMSAVWSADVNATEPEAQPGWNVTLTVVAAATPGDQPGVGTLSNASITNRLPEASTVVAATKVFTFSIQLNQDNVLEDADLTVEGPPPSYPYKWSGSGFNNHLYAEVEEDYDTQECESYPYSYH